MMDLKNTLGRRATRRSVLGIMAGTGATAVLAACTTDDEGTDEQGQATEADDEATDEPVDEEDDDEPEDDGQDEEEVDESDETPVAEEDEETLTATATEDADSDDGGAEAEVIVGDVIDFTLEPEERWDGPFGSVTMQLHRGWVNGEDVTFIRTDASDEEFANQEELVYVPLLQNVLDQSDSQSNIYLFEDGPDDQLPVLSTSPADGEAFSPAFLVHFVSNADGLEAPLTSEQETLDAADAGDITVESADIVVNYPVITWPGGQIPVDEDKTEYLGGGQLLEEPDIEGGQVTMKLHQCYPNSRYVVTDTSALPMAPMMGAGEAGATQTLIEADAVAPITIFLNGLEGPGAQGFQPGIFNTSAGDPAWSPFWEHFAAEWNNEEEAVAVTSQQQLNVLVDDGTLTLYGGVPDTDPDTFVVNCPVPILAPVSWEPPE